MQPKPHSAMLHHNYFNENFISSTIQVHSKFEQNHVLYQDIYLRQKQLALWNSRHLVSVQMEMNYFSNREIQNLNQNGRLILKPPSRIPVLSM